MKDPFEADKIKKCFDLVLKFFKDDYIKTIWWFSSKNANFGGSEPSRLMNQGRVDKVLKFIETSLEENER